MEVVLKSNRRGIVITIIMIVGLAILVGFSWVNYQLLLRYAVKEMFTPRYLGTRSLLMKGWSPYSKESSAEMQKAVDGSPTDPGEGPTLYLYPLYAFPIYSPFALVDDIMVAKAVWMTALELSLMVIAGFSLTLSRWRISLILTAIILIFSLTWYYGLRPVLDGDVAILSALCIVMALAAIRADIDVLAGFLLALATIKPSLIPLLAVFLLLWAISHRRWLLVWSFTGSLVLIVAATSLFVPSWTIEYIRQLVVYFRNPEINTPGAILTLWLPGVGKQIGWILTGIILAILIWEWRQAWGKEFRWSFWTACLTLAAIPLVGIPTSIDNYIISFPAIILVFAVWAERWGVLGRVMLVLSLVILSAGVWGYVWIAYQNGIQPDRSPVIILLLPIVTILSLYWIRWWAINPPRLPLHGNET